MAVPALVVLLLAGVTAVSAVTTRMRCVDAAREAALAAARGEPGVQAGSAAAPEAASVSVTRTADRVEATIQVRISPLGPRLPGFTVGGRAVAAVEPGQGGDGG